MSDKSTIAGEPCPWDDLFDYSHYRVSKVTREVKMASYTARYCNLAINSGVLNDLEELAVMVDKPVDELGRDILAGQVSLLLKAKRHLKLDLTPKGDIGG